MSLADELHKLQELHQRGVLTDAEYAQAKASLLQQPPKKRVETPPIEANGSQDLLDTSSQTGGNIGAVMTVIGLSAIAIAAIVYFAFIRPASSEFSGGLTLRVDRVETTDNRFLVHMTATNHTKDKLTVGLFGYFFVTDDFGNQYEADPFASTFPRDIAPGATVSGYAVMKTPLHPNATKLKVAFTTVFGSFAVKSASVEGVPVR